MARSLFVVALLGALVAASAVSDLAADWMLRQEFDLFKTKFSKTYESESEELLRFDIFKQSVERVVRKNKEHNTDVFGITQFSDLTTAEFRAGFLNTLPTQNDAPVHQPRSNAQVASSFDWRDKGVVTDVKNQGMCGSCWAHSACETIESAWALAGNTLTEFSVQQITSCDTSDYGCRGGFPSTAYEYVESAGGLATEADYPYTDAKTLFFTSACSSDFTVSGGDVSSWSYATDPCTEGSSCTSQDEATLISNLYNVQPLSIVVDASEWSDYTGGIFPTSSCSSAYDSMDHAIQLVGYSGYSGATETSDYYLVRNSWDTTWGEEGYIYLPIGENACGIANLATMVTVA